MSRNMTTTRAGAGAGVIHGRTGHVHWIFNPRSRFDADMLALGFIESPKPGCSCTCPGLSLRVNRTVVHGLVDDAFLDALRAIDPGTSLRDSGLYLRAGPGPAVISNSTEARVRFALARAGNLEIMALAVDGRANGLLWHPRQHQKPRKGNL